MNTFFTSPSQSFGDLIAEAAVGKALFISDTKTFTGYDTYNYSFGYSHPPWARRCGNVDTATRHSVQKPFMRAAIFSLAVVMSGLWETALSATIYVAPNTPPGIRSDGRCSLVEAITNANNGAATYPDCARGSRDDRIVLPAGSRQTLTAVHNSTHGASGLPVISATLAIDGQNSTIERSSTATSFRIFTVSGNLSLNQLTVKGGQQGWYYPTRGYNGGCGLLNYRGTVTIANSTFSDNRCEVGDRGGAINNYFGSLKIINSNLVRNSAKTGGALAQDHASAVITGTVLAENTALTYDGGAIWNGASSLSLERSRVSDNRANYGGGIRQEWDSSADIREVTISNNVALNTGGGIENGAASTLTLFKSTVSGNKAAKGGGGISTGSLHNQLSVVSSTISGNTSESVGGGIFSWGGGPITVTRSTVILNHAATGGGGIAVSDGPFVLLGTVVSGNTTAAGTGPNFRCQGACCGSSAVSNKRNLFGSDARSGVAGFVPGSADVVPTQPLSWILDPRLGANGGPTHTHALVPGSPAIDAGDPDYQKWIVFGAESMYDQRGPGFTRFSGDCIDIGAFEFKY